MMMVGEYLNPNNCLILIGDFNCNMSKDQQVKSCIQRECQVKHCVTEPTYQTLTGSLTTIDYVFSNVTQTQTTTIECPYSDHKIIGVSLGSLWTILHVDTGAGRCEYPQWE